MLEKNEDFKVIDDYLSIDEYKKTWEFVQQADYHPGEKDHHDSYPIGMVAELKTDNAATFRLFPRTVNGAHLTRCYINYYSQGEVSAFHTDHDDPDSYTLLYYPCPTYSLDEGGTTELYIGNHITGIQSVANRLLIFKSTITHRATPFKSHQRFTIAFKYQKYADTGY